MKVKRMGIPETLRRIWLISANKIKSSEFFSKQPTQLIVELNSSLLHIIVTIIMSARVFRSTCKDHFKYKRNVGCGWAGWPIAYPGFGISVTSIPTRQGITTCPPSFK